MTCEKYLGGITADEYLLKVANCRFRQRAPSLNKRRLILQAQRNENDLSLYLEGAADLPPDGTSVNLITFTVPSGMDAIITNVRNTWSGSGFQNGDGLLLWKYRIGGGYIFQRGNVTFQNTASNGWALVGSGGAYLYENQQLIIEADTNSGASGTLLGGKVEAQVTGWFIPKN